MSEFKITGPGDYRDRRGRKRSIIPRESHIFSWVEAGGCETWTHGGFVNASGTLNDSDLVAPWSEPWKPEVGKRAKHASARAVTVIAVRGDFAWVEDRSNCPFTAFVTSLSPPDPEIHTGKVGPYEVKVTVTDDKATAEIVQ